jgi:hypothetical protein
LTKARDIADFKFENIVDIGTEGTKVATGTTGQRGSTQGQIRFNTTTGLAEYYNGSSFTKLEGTPVVTSISPNNIDSDSNALPQNITITGNNFQSGATVTFIDSAGVSVNSTSVTFNNSTTLVAQVPNSVNIAQQPFDVKVNNPTGLSASLTDGLQISAAPAWTTNAGSLGSIGDRTNATLSVVATDPDGGAITYSETTSNVLGGAGLTLNTSTGAITGTPNDVSTGGTTINFTIRATDNEGSTTDRAFAITITYQLDGSSGRPFIKVPDADGFAEGSYYIETSSGSSEQLYFYHYNNFAYATVGGRYKSSSAQTSVNSNGSVGTPNNGTTTFKLSVTKINYLMNQNTNKIGMMMVPQQADGKLVSTNKEANLFRTSTTDKTLVSDIFTANNADISGRGAVRIDLSTLNPDTTYPTSGWQDFQNNSHQGGNQILSIFNSNNGSSLPTPFGLRWTNANGHGYHGGAQMNDVTGSGRDLTASEPISLFLLVR